MTSLWDVPDPEEVQVAFAKTRIRSDKEGEREARRPGLLPCGAKRENDLQPGYGNGPKQSTKSRERATRVCTF